MALGPGLTYKAFLKGRQPNPRLAREYSDLVKSRTPRPSMPPSGRTSGDMPSPSSASSTRPIAAVSSGTRTNGSRIKTNPRFDTTGVRVDPSRIRTERFTPPPTPPSSGTPPMPPAGERLVAGKNFAERVAANAAKRGVPAASRMSQLGSAVGKVVRPVAQVMNSPAGKMAGRVGLAYYGAKSAGDLFGAVEPYLDMARYGHKLPYKDGVGGRDNRLNDVLGNIPFNVREAMTPGQTQKDLSALTGGVSDKVLKTIMPYRERAKAEPAAFKKPDGVGGPKTAGQKPMTPAPDGPSSIADIGRQGRGQSKAMRDPESYLGSAFDATLRKGIDTGRNYLRSQMNKDGLDADDQSKIMARFDSKIAKDKELSLEANKGGIINTIKAKDEARAGRTLEAYRGQRGQYKGNTSYAKMQEKYVK